MKRWKHSISILALACVAGTVQAADVIVSAAASLTNAFTDIGREFEKMHAGQKILFNFAGSGALLQQIARGAPVDVFASADQDTMDKAFRQNLILRSSLVDFTHNTLVLVVPAKGGPALADLDGLRAPAVARIAISNPQTVPAGKYAKDALVVAGLWDVLEKKFINTRNVRQSLDYIARGEVDAGFVYATDAAIMPERVRVLFDVPTKTPIAYPIAVVKGNGKERLALDFIEFVKSPPAQAILAKYGFTKP